MTTEDLRVVLKASPFRPFLILTTGGREFVVRHPELVFHPEGYDLIILTSPPRGLDLIDLEHVEALRYDDVPSSGVTRN